MTIKHSCSTWAFSDGTVIVLTCGGDRVELKIYNHTDFTVICTYGDVRCNQDGTYRVEMMIPHSWSDKYGSVKAILDEGYVQPEVADEISMERILLYTMNTAFCNAIRECKFREIESLISKE